ncbi:MAG: hypothetical protein ACOC1F_09040, partial [Myxococcota bacterium]
MEFELGIVCGRCDRYSPMGTETCVCGHDLSLFKVPPIPSNEPSARPSKPGAIRRPSRPEEVVPSGAEAVSSHPREASRFAH